jgi:hypothetical protein
MGKRGPAAKGEFGDKSAVLSTRISAELRSALERSVAESGLTLSREIEHRLRRTFSEDEKISEGFGTRRNRALMKMAAMLMQTMHRSDSPDVEWLDDPWLFDQYVIRLNALLEACRPPAEARMPAGVYGVPALDNEETHRIVSRGKALQLLQDVQRADASLPLAAGRRGRANILKADLGPVVDRTEFVVGTAAQFRALAQKHSSPRPKAARVTKRKRK